MLIASRIASSRNPSSRENPESKLQPFDHFIIIIWGFPTFGIPYWGPDYKGILLFGVYIRGPLISHTPIWVVVKIMVPFGVPNIIIRHLNILSCPKRDPNFDNYPYP